MCVCRGGGGGGGPPYRDRINSLRAVDLAGLPVYPSSTFVNCEASEELFAQDKNAGVPVDRFRQYVYGKRRGASSLENEFKVGLCTTAAVAAATTTTTAAAASTTTTTTTTAAAAAAATTITTTTPCYRNRNG